MKLIKRNSVSENAARHKWMESTLLSDWNDAAEFQNIATIEYTSSAFKNTYLQMRECSPSGIFVKLHIFCRILKRVSLKITCRFRVERNLYPHFATLSTLLTAVKDKRDWKTGKHVWKKSKREIKLCSDLDLFPVCWPGIRLLRD